MNKLIPAQINKDKLLRGSELNPLPKVGLIQKPTNTQPPADPVKAAEPAAMKPSDSGAKLSVVPSRASERSQKNTMLSDYFSKKKAMK